MDPPEISQSILPALVTLSTDTEKRVRVATIGPFGEVAANTGESSILEKIFAQFESVIEQNENPILLKLLSVISSIIPRVQPNFRDQFLLPKLIKITKENGNAPKEVKGDTANAIFEAFKAFNGCTLSPSLIQKYIVPGLNLLKEQISAESYRAQLSTMLKEMMENSKVEEHPQQSQITSNSQQIFSNTPTDPNKKVEKVSLLDKFKNWAQDKDTK